MEATPRDPHDHEDKIYDYIENAQEPVYVKKISDDTGIPRKTVEKWVWVLVATGRIEAVGTVGPSIVFDTV